MVTGVIFDIKEFAIYDGPGIRTTVFLKGCPMHCSWCHNPEGLSARPELMIAKNNCTHCQKCIEACPYNGIRCDLCGRCLSVCPLHLRKICGNVMSTSTLAQRLLKDADYFNKYGGGVTFSGGEPTYQPDFLIESASLLTGIHKCIETCGYCSPSTFKSIIDCMDYIIMDLKIIDPFKHRAHTGVSNEVILHNLEQLKISKKPFVIRIPVIPEVNDDNENYIATAKLLTGCPYLERVELLPYHHTAGAKYPLVHRDYQPSFPINKAPRLNTDIFEEYHIPATHL